MKLTDRLYGYLWQGRGNNCNTFLYAGTKNVLIDPGHIRNEFGENCLEILLQSMSADGFVPEKIDLLLCTHGHPDHCESGQTFQEKYQIKVAMHEKEEAHMQKIAHLFGQMTGKKPVLPVPDFYLQEGELELGTKNKEIIQVYHTPGHSPGSLSFYFPSEQALVTGDAVFEGSIGRTDFPEGSMSVLGESIEKLSQLKNVEWLLPGHMRFIQGQQQIKNNFRTIKRFFFS